MIGFIFDAVSVLFIFGFVPLFLTVATVWILWQVLEKINPDEVKDIQSFLTFIVVVVPFVVLIYGELTIVLYDEMTAASGGLHPVFLPLAPEVIPVGAAIYIGLAVWAWSHWRKLRR